MRHRSKWSARHTPHTLCVRDEVDGREGLLSYVSLSRVVRPTRLAVLSPWSARLSCMPMSIYIQVLCISYYRVCFTALPRHCCLRTHQENHTKLISDTSIMSSASDWPQYCSLTLALSTWHPTYQIWANGLGDGQSVDADTELSSQPPGTSVALYI